MFSGFLLFMHNFSLQISEEPKNRTESSRNESVTEFCPALISTSYIILSIYFNKDSKTFPVSGFEGRVISLEIILPASSNKMKRGIPLIA